ncbi:sensor domain-containing diguanylate cyclase [Lacticaseibacillus sharpeae]|uniref:Signal transduction diguanylate cyclase n=1 Tax=Lacticaseibacillus sharpeae JCM 1186 = DSM 20505 TaxID=1291052 RepID=A0A0R1ZLE5_9LACO|nr:diguanylate cyclase [Lacticaseibacillus sharpeae]KRM55789.1 Signal transduction diguanylate cyclase [Lacticaseibacillus sharpeae JCM 1186 = DSM 20505]
MHILGMHIAMTMNLIMQPLSLWLAQIIVGVFFISGFIRHYQNIYHDAFLDENYAHRTLARLALMVLSIGVGFMLHMIGYMTINTGLMFHNLGLFLLVFTLLDADINLAELSARTAALLLVWLMHHSGHFDRPEFWLSIVLLAIGFVALRKWRRPIRAHLWASIAVFTYCAVIFWTLLPPFTIPEDAMWITIRGIIMFVAYGTMAAFLWHREHLLTIKREQLQKLADFDQLTNAKTYSLYQHDVTDMFEQTRAEGKPMSLTALDIDHFKQINDHYGHLAGNAVLIGVARTLNETLNKYGDSHQIYRTGGEEFNIAFPGQAPADVLPIITDCWNAVRKEHYQYEGFDIGVTLSMGLTQVCADDVTIDDTYKRADDNLYLSKRAGRDTITVEGETVQTRAQHDLIATYTYFTQGIMQVGPETATRYRNELLLRMFDHEHDRWILPDMFDISVATQINLLQKTIDMTDIGRMSINLTLAQFMDEAVARSLVDFSNNDAQLEELIVEITDVPDAAIMRQISAIYRAGGVHIFIDDVGSDNSYEVVRKLLPYVDGVKFAMQNLRKETSADSMRERITFWHQIATDKHIEFVLEGVENSNEVEYARDELGITLMQGYYYNKPGLPVM